MKNILKICTLFIVLFNVFVLKAQDHTVPLHQGEIISHSITIKKKVYHFNHTDSLYDAPVIIEGDNIIVDFNGSVIDGSLDAENPDRFTGTAVIIKSGKNITIKNLAVKGFKVGLMAKGINGLKIVSSDFSYNFRQHLNSNREREDLADWQSYHHNEKDEWLRFGAGIYLRNCDSADIHDNTVIGGQCGLMITGCNRGLIYNNNFSFNSGIGIGMYGSSNNRVLYNKLDWNVRGFSDGVYYRGQDSAGILVFEQCDDNTFAWNSVTHSGDGFFLWAGQTTMDSGEGGCNDNLLFSNDFSYAPTNGVELTFSRNKVINNIIHDCWHGVWGGFSYNTIIANNDFAGNMSSIAIEHGKDNIIDQNTFTGEKVGIELWSNPKRPKDFGYLKKRDTRSINYSIRNNTFTDVKNIFNINNTDNVVIDNNKIAGSTLQQKFDTTLNDLEIDKTGSRAKPVIDSSYFPKPGVIVRGQNTRLAASQPQDKKYIMMTEWGPYSFKYPIAWRNKTDSSGKIGLDMLGPAGKWKIIGIKGATALTNTSGVLPGNVAIRKDTSALTNIDIKFEYTGDAVTSAFGKKYRAGQPYYFYYRQFDIPYKWETKWFVFDTTSDPVKNEAKFRQLMAGKPVKTTEGAELSTVFGKGFGKNIAREKIATVSSSTINVPERLYKIGISASEMVRVYIDNKLIIENWDPSRLIYDADYHRDAVLPLKGRHIIRVEQAQYGEYGMLNLIIKPVYKEN